MSVNFVLYIKTKEKNKKKKLKKKKARQRKREERQDESDDDEDDDEVVQPNAGQFNVSGKGEDVEIE